MSLIFFCYSRPDVLFLFECILLDDLHSDRYLQNIWVRFFSSYYFILTFSTVVVSQIRPIRKHPAQDSSSRFFTYCLFGWLAPMLASVSAVSLDLAEVSWLRPNFAVHSCWFYGQFSLHDVLRICGWTKNCNAFSPPK